MKSIHLLAMAEKGFQNPGLSIKGDMQPKDCWPLLALSGFLHQGISLMTSLLEGFCQCALTKVCSVIGFEVDLPDPGRFINQEIAPSGGFPAFES